MESMNDMVRFKEEMSLEERKKRFKKMVESYPETVALIIEPHPEISKEDWGIIKHSPCFKVLLRKGNNLSRVLHMIRSRIKLPQTQALFLYTTSEKTVKNGFIEGIMKKRQTRLVNLTKDISQVYMANKDPEDGFLYIQYGFSPAYGA